MNTKQFYIDGAWVDPIDGTDLDVINPSTEEVCATISLGGKADTEAAVAAAAVASKKSSSSSSIIDCQGREREGGEQLQGERFGILVPVEEQSSANV